MLKSGTRIGEFEIVGLIATGGMSQVYRASRIHDGEPVAVKILHEAWCGDDELRARFCNEASVLEQIDHPCIVTAMERGITPEGAPFMILEWLPSTLERVLVLADGRILYHLAARVTTHVARALAALHQRGIIHRDLKPSNILLSQNDLSTATIKLGDLGLAKIAARGPGHHGADTRERVAAAVPVSTGGNTVLGTWDYMAPEQWIQAKQATPVADVYALGVILFRMLAGRLPFIADDERTLMALHLFEEPSWKLLDSPVEPTPTKLGDRLVRMLSKRIGDRPSIDTVIRWFSAPEVAADGGS